MNFVKALQCSVLIVFILSFNSLQAQKSTQKQLEEKNTEIAGLNEYIEKLESIATPSKLKKLNPEKFTEENIVEQPVSNLFAIKVNDGSSF